MVNRLVRSSARLFRFGRLEAIGVVGLACSALLTFMASGHIPFSLSDVFGAWGQTSGGQQHLVASGTAMTDGYGAPAGLAIMSLTTLLRRLLWKILWWVKAVAIVAMVAIVSAAAFWVNANAF